MKKTEILDNVQVETIEGKLRFQVIISGQKYAKPSYTDAVFVEFRNSDGRKVAYKLGHASNIEEFVKIVKLHRE